MKKFFCFILQFCFFSTFIFASEKIIFSITPVAGYTYGTIKEQWYADSKGNYSSLLEWDKHLWLCGFNSELFYKTLKIKTGGTFFIPGACGYMQDSDWMNENNLSMKTTYSTGVNYAIKNYDAFFSCAKSFSFLNFSKCFLLPEIAFNFKYDSFERLEAKGWYGQSTYSSDGLDHWWYDDEAKEFPYTYWSEEKNKYVTQKLSGISYTRKAYFLWLGINFDVEPTTFFRLNFCALVSPYSFMQVIDTHHGRETSYKMNLNGFFTWGYFSLDAIINFSKVCALKIKCSALAGKSSYGSVCINNALYARNITGCSEYNITSYLGLSFFIK